MRVGNRVLSAVDDAPREPCLRRSGGGNRLRLGLDGVVLAPAGSRSAERERRERERDESVNS